MGNLRAMITEHPLGGVMSRVARFAEPGKGLIPSLVVVALLTSGCDPGPGEDVYRSIVENRCEVPIRVDVNGVRGVERIPRVEDQDLLAPGESRRLSSSFVEVDTTYVSVSRESATETENTYPFRLATMTPEPTEESHITAYRFVIEGEMCPAD